MSAASRTGLCVVLVLAAVALEAGELPGRAVAVEATSAPQLHEWSRRIDRLLAGRELAVRVVRDDTMIAGRRHERMAQLHRGVPVWGGELVVQSDAAGPLTVFGNYYEGIDLAVEPSLRAADAGAIVERRGGHPFGSRGGPELTVLPLADGGYRLAWRVRAVFPEAWAIRQSFYDAHTGALLLEYADLQHQAAAIGTGVLGEREKLSVAPGGAGWQTSDHLRPPLIATYDFRFDLGRFIEFLNSQAPPELLFRPSDLGTDEDNVWTDGALVDAHAYAGFTYDYFYRRHGRQGLDDANIAIHSVTHALRREDWSRYSVEVVGALFANAAYLGDGIMYYGDGLPPNVSFYGQHYNYMAGGLDVVAHELTHGVTDYSSRLVYQGESGALNESFSDIMAAGVEFAFQPGRADYLCGEDVVTPGGVRSMQSPMAFGAPDHYSIRYLGADDNGGVHWNSGISNNAFYLAIEGGRHRLGGVVEGVGAPNREQIERSFYRGFTAFLTPRATFSQARAATLQAARELYGSGSPAARALTQAWTAVGVS